MFASVVYMLVLNLSVRPSLCLSVKSQYPIKIVKELHSHKELRLLAKGLYSFLTPNASVGIIYNKDSKHIRSTGKSCDYRQITRSRKQYQR